MKTELKTVNRQLITANWLAIRYTLYAMLFAASTHAQTLTANDMLGIVQCADSACFSPKILSKAFSFKNVDKGKNTEASYGYLNKYVCNEWGDSCDIILYVTIAKKPVFKSLWLFPPDDDARLLVLQFIKAGFEKFTPVGDKTVLGPNTYYQNKTLNMVFVDEFSPDFLTHSFLLVQTTNFNPALEY